MSNYRTCPKCGLISSGNAERCDCGYNFETGQQDPLPVKSGPGATSHGGVLSRVLLFLGVLFLAFAGINAPRESNVSALVGTFLPGLFLLIIGLKLGQAKDRSPDKENSGH
jgi:hypothetical protein